MSSPHRRAPAEFGGTCFICTETWTTIQRASIPFCVARNGPVARAGKRVSRLNPKPEWIVRDVPELRIVAQELWDCVKARQKAVRTKRGTKTENGFWDRRRPRHLFSGLAKCGVCGGGHTTLYRNRLGCSRQGHL